LIVMINIIITRLEELGFVAVFESFIVVDDWEQVSHPCASLHLVGSRLHRRRRRWSAAVSAPG
jgi:hypothetical protein